MLCLHQPSQPTAFNSVASSASCAQTLLLQPPVQDSLSRVKLTTAPFLLSLPVAATAHLACPCSEPMNLTHSECLCIRAFIWTRSLLRAAQNLADMQESWSHLSCSVTSETLKMYDISGWEYNTTGYNYINNAFTVRTQRTPMFCTLLRAKSIYI